MDQENVQTLIYKHPFPSSPDSNETTFLEYTECFILMLLYPQDMSPFDTIRIFNLKKYCSVENPTSVKKPNSWEPNITLYLLHYTPSNYSYHMLTLC